MIKEPNTWRNPEEHYIKVMDDLWFKLLVKLQNLLTIETVKFYENRDIVTMHLPVTTGAISSPMGRGSDSLPVKINIEGVDTYLADSMQFLLEYGCRLTEKGVYYIMPSFRGEKADSSHLCQFYHSEAEIIGNLEDIMNLVEEYIKYLSKKIIEKLGDELKKSIGDISHIEAIANYNGHFPQITFDEAERELKKVHGNKIDKYIEYKNGWRNITRLGEKEILKLHNGLVWITNYDILAVPFYQRYDHDIKGTTRNADLLMGIGETVGCGERHLDHNELIDALDFHEVNHEEYKWYIDMKKIKPLNTAGFGMGTERFFMWVLKSTDIRNMQICLRFNGEKSIL